MPTIRSSLVSKEIITRVRSAIGVDYEFPSDIAIRCGLATLKVAGVLNWLVRIGEVESMGRFIDYELREVYRKKGVKQ